MKIRWKKINRGLLLGAVLLVGLVGFIVFKHQQFQKEVPEIRSTVQAYVQDMLELNLSTEDAKLGKMLSEKDLAAKKAQLEGILSTYWTTGEDDYYYYDLDEVRANYEEMLNLVNTVIFYSLEGEVPENRIKVTQNGPDYAEVRVTVNNFAAEYEGFGENLFIYEAQRYYGVYEDIEVVDPDYSYSSDTTRYKGIYNGQLILNMHRVDGEWRIVSITGGVWLNSVSTVEKGETIK